jgi:hypothetical protein
VKGGEWLVDTVKAEYSEEVEEEDACEPENWFEEEGRTGHGEWFGSDGLLLGVSG